MHVSELWEATEPTENPSRHRENREKREEGLGFKPRTSEVPMYHPEEKMNVCTKHYPNLGTHQLISWFSIEGSSQYFGGLGPAKTYGSHFLFWSFLCSNHCLPHPFFFLRHHFPTWNRVKGGVTPNTSPCHHQRVHFSQSAFPFAIHTHCLPGGNQSLLKRD